MSRSIAAQPITLETFEAAALKRDWVNFDRAVAPIVQHFAAAIPAAKGDRQRVELATRVAAALAVHLVARKELPPQILTVLVLLGREIRSIFRCSTFRSIDYLQAIIGDFDESGKLSVSGHAQVVRYAMALSLESAGRSALEGLEKIIPRQLVTKLLLSLLSDPANVEESVRRRLAYLGDRSRLQIDEPDLLDVELSSRLWIALAEEIAPEARAASQVLAGNVASWSRRHSGSESTGVAGEQAGGRLIIVIEGWEQHDQHELHTLVGSLAETFAVSIVAPASAGDQQLDHVDRVYLLSEQLDKLPLHIAELREIKPSALLFLSTMRSSWSLVLASSRIAEFQGAWVERPVSDMPAELDRCYVDSTKQPAEVDQNDRAVALTWSDLGVAIRRQNDL
jgi:hypothetical protein